jgi:PKD repeat protein
VQGVSPYWQSGPQTFSLETWLRTNTNSGGKILGFGDSNTGRSNIDGTDRLLYMNNAGQIYFGVRPDMGARVTINTAASYRDNQWHHIVGTLGSDGMKLYVDGNQVAANTAVTKAQVYRGYWRVGGDRLTNWPSSPNREAIAANIDEVAVYPKALTIGHIRAHYLASGRSTVFPNISPTASFSSSAYYLTGSFDGTGSTDDDGTIASYAWNFGDSTTGTGPTPQHLYATAGTYTVTLTVTDDRGGTGTVTGSVTVTAPPANITPHASFTAAVTYHMASFTSTSTDEDGTIASYSWDFGDGSTGAGATPSHLYATIGTYTVTLTVTDNRGGTATTTGSVTITNAYASDKFERVVSNGLGTADNGGPWTSSGTASAFSTGNGVGRITGAVAANRAAYLNSIHQTDMDIKAQLSIDTASSGGGGYVSVIGRRVSNGNDYRLKLRYQPDGSVFAYVTRTVGGTETILASTTVPGLRVNPGDLLRTRFLVTGATTTTVSAKVWRKGTMEPQAWLVTNTSATPAALQAPGDIGVLVYLSGTWAGAAPIVSIDNLNVGADSGPPVNTPPTASFTTNAQYLKTWLDGSASTDVDEDGKVVSYAWNFGDGSSGTGATPQHTYSAAGTYTVSLTVTDNGGATGTTTAAVTVNSAPPPTAFFVITDVNVLSASFDGGGSSDVDGTITSYAWNFGDGAVATGPNAQHTYAAAGTYTVTLTVTDNDGNTGTASETLVVHAPPPTAAFTSNTSYLHASFDGTGSSGTITGYAWNFGDSTSGTGATPQHTYAAAGIYTVTLTVTDNDGRTAATTGQVTTTDAPLPTAAFTSSLSYLRASFDASGSSDADGTITGYAWNFGDSATGTGPTPQHTYAAARTYTVTLTVTDNDGHTGTITHDVTATNPPPPTAGFTSSTSDLTASFNGSGSSDVDGTITGYAWNFGDSATGTGPTPQHTYAAGGTYTVTLTVTDNDGHTGTTTGQVTVFDPAVQYASDTFTRTVTNGLGTADFGGPWTLSGTASGFSVANGVGRIAGAVAANRAAYLTGPRQTDIDMTTDVALDRASTGGGAYFSLIGRRVSSGNDYRLKLRYMPDGSVIAYLVRTVGATETILASATVAGLTVNPGDMLRARFVVSGTTTTTLRAKVWRKTSQEPQNWLVTNTGATPAALQTTGDVGILLYVSGSWTGTAPAVTIDNVAALAPTG